MKNQYDYIIVGGGTSGIITATKLIEHGASVLILEEGNKSNNLLLSMPAGWIKGLENSPYLKFYESIAQKQLNNRQHFIAQAKTLGGGSKVNGMVYMRGKPSDYNKWEEETGDTIGIGILFSNILLSLKIMNVSKMNITEMRVI